MQFHFYFVDRNERERYHATSELIQPIEVLHEAQRIADHLVTDPAYLCDFGHAHLRIESEDQAIVMRLSIKSVFDLQDSHSARAA